MLVVIVQKCFMNADVQFCVKIHDIFKIECIEGHRAVDLHILPGNSAADFFWE